MIFTALENCWIITLVSITVIYELNDILTKYDKYMATAWCTHGCSLMHTWSLLGCIFLQPLHELVELLGDHLWDLHDFFLDGESVVLLAQIFIIFVELLLQVVLQLLDDQLVLHLRRSALAGSLLLEELFNFFWGPFTWRDQVFYMKPIVLDLKLICSSGLLSWNRNYRIMMHPCDSLLMVS